MSANAGRYVAFLPRVVASCWLWGWTSEWPEMSFVTLATGIWGRYHGRAAYPGSAHPGAPTP